MTYRKKGWILYAVGAVMILASGVPHYSSQLASDMLVPAGNWPIPIVLLVTGALVAMAGHVYLLFPRQTRQLLPGCRIIAAPSALGLKPYYPCDKLLARLLSLFYLIYGKDLSYCKIQKEAQVQD